MSDLPLNRKPSRQLAAIIGKGPTNQVVAIDALREYAEARGLLTPRSVRCDAKLRALTGVDEISRFDFSLLIAERHLEWLPAPRPPPAPLRKPDAELAMCIGDEPDTAVELAQELANDLEEMRWSRGSGPSKSALIPQLQALVDAAGDPYAVPQAALLELVMKHSTPWPPSARATKVSKPKGKRRSQRRR